MPVNFLTAEQRNGYGCYKGEPSSEDLSRCFHLDDTDLVYISEKRGDCSRLGCALQITTVRFLGTFLEDPVSAPGIVIHTLAKQLNIPDTNCLIDYRKSRLRWMHTTEIRTKYGYCEFVNPIAGFQLTRWLYMLCWTGTDRPSVLFERATTWLFTHKVLLPGVSILERFVAKIRSRVESRLWNLLVQGITLTQQKQLEDLLQVPDNNRTSLLDRLRSGPIRVSAPAFVNALQRIQEINDLGIILPAVPNIPLSRITALSRFASAAKVTAINRLPPTRRLATLVAFIHCLKASAHDDALDVLDMLLGDIFRRAATEDKKNRLRTLKDLDKAATKLADASEIVLDATLSDNELRSKIYEKVSQEALEKALQEIRALTRPFDDVYFCELEKNYRSIRRFLPSLLKYLHFEANPAGKAVTVALDWLNENEPYAKKIQNAPRDVIKKSWQHHVIQEDGMLNHRAYTFCVLDELHVALKKRDIFVKSGWRYADPRSGLLAGEKWEMTKPTICRTLGFSVDPQPVLTALATELDQTYHAVAARLPNNPFIQFKSIGDKKELVLSPLNKLEEPASLIELRKIIAERLPRVELPEILLEIAARTHYTDAFTHVSQQTARTTDFSTSLCAVLLSEACNTGIEPLVRNDIPTLKFDRLSWVLQNYVRDDTISASNAILVSAQNKIPLVKHWGGGEVTSADGMRFVVPIRTVHAGHNSKYWGQERGVTWYNLISDQFSGLNAITIPGTLRDSLFLLAVVLEQETELHPTKIMTDTGAYSDVIFGLFRLLGFRFCPRLADIGGTRFWRINSDSDYGQLNDIARQKINLNFIAMNWDDMLRLAGSLILGLVPATGIMRTLQVGERPTPLAKAIAEFGRIDKTLHTLTYIDDEAKRRDILTQLNRGEGRHSLARVVFHGQRGELRQKYREGQEDQLGALGLVLNIIVLWNTIYIDAVINALRQEGYPVRDEDIERLSPLIYGHINMLGRYLFSIPETVLRGELRKLRNPNSGEN
jgi:TnpA family transposase